MLVGREVDMEMVGMMKGVLGMVVLGCILGMVVREYGKGWVRKGMSERLGGS